MENPTDEYETVNENATGMCPSEPADFQLHPVKDPEREKWICPLCLFEVGEENSDEMLQNFRFHTVRN